MECVFVDAKNDSKPLFGTSGKKIIEVNPEMQKSPGFPGAKFFWQITMPGDFLGISFILFYNF